MNLNPKLATVLAPAYAPCLEFQRACTEMRWDPSQGHVPRGSLGATGSLEEVELVLVFAEPGDPHAGEQHSGLESAYKYATFGFWHRQRPLSPERAKDPQHVLANVVFRTANAKGLAHRLSAVLRTNGRRFCVGCGVSRLRAPLSSGATVPVPQRSCRRPRQQGRWSSEIIGHRQLPQRPCCRAAGLQSSRSAAFVGASSA